MLGILMGGQLLMRPCLLCDVNSIPRASGDAPISKPSCADQARHLVAGNAHHPPVGARLMIRMEMVVVFAGVVRTELGEEFALFDAERHAIDSIRLGAFVAFDQLVDFDDSHGC